ncbi:MAG: site-specific integrase [bacterium]
MSNLHDRMIHDMQLHGYAERTREAYVRTVRQLQQFYDLAPEAISEDQLRDYFIHRKNVSRWSAATMRIAYSGIKFFYTYTLKRDWGTLKLIRAENERKLPVVLTIDEVHSILQAVNSPHNKAYLTVVYCCGLRLQEGLHLQVADIDGKRQLIHIHLGKGAKDRYVPLPDSTLAVLRDYWKTHRNEQWIFPRIGRSRKEGPTATEPMNKETVHGALRRVLKTLPAITKPVRVHTFRHSYATHLLEAGVNIRLVQQYLGHSSLASTMIYAHVTRVGHQDACQRINRLMQGVRS